MKEEWKCKIKDGKFLAPCTNLNRSFKDIGRAGGLEFHEYSKDFKPSRSFAVLKSGEFKSKGIAFNVCPFCGVDISSPFKEVVLP